MKYQKKINKVNYIEIAYYRINDEFLISALKL